MKKAVIIFAMFVVTFSFSANAQKKNKYNITPVTVTATTNTNSGSVGAVSSPPMKDFTNSLNRFFYEPATKKKIQFYAGDTITLVMGVPMKTLKGVDTLVFTADKPVITPSGAVTLVDTRFVVKPTTMGTFWKNEGELVWITFAIDSGILPGDTISIPFLPNGVSDNTSYVCKSVGATAGLVNALPKKWNQFTLAYGSKVETFQITKGAGAVPLKMVIDRADKFTVVKNKAVNAAPAVTATQAGFDPFLIQNVNQ